MPKVRGKTFGGLTGDRPQLTQQLEKARGVGVARLRQRLPFKRRVLLLLAAAVLSGATVFGSGYAAGLRRGGSAPRNSVVRTFVLRGTSVAPHARARVEVWSARGPNRPITLRVIGLPKSPPRTYYEVDLARGGKPWEPCGTFRVPTASHAVTLTLNAPFALRKGDTWVVTREASGRKAATLGRESGITALRQV